MQKEFEKKMTALRNKLQKAAEIELTTIPPYLTAMLSIMPGSNVESATIIRSVMMEEMLHLTLAANTLSAIGGSLKLGKKNIPVYPARLEFKGKAFRDREFDVNLAPFNKPNIETFLKIELPDGFKSPGLQKPASKEVVIKGYTLGDFYRGIEKDLCDLCKEYGEKKVFCGDFSKQVSEEFFWADGGRPIMVRNLKTALAALTEIIDQGEGTPGSINDGDNYFGEGKEVAHYFRFNEIYEGRYYKDTDKPHQKPSGKKLVIDYKKVYPIKDNCKSTDFARSLELQALNYSFNEAYSLMLKQIEEGFNGNPRVLYTAIMNGMHRLSPVARQMMQHLIPGDRKKRHAAPSFEWVDPPMNI